MKKAKELKKGDKVFVGEVPCKVDEIEISDMGKQGTKKVRIVASNSKGEKIVIVRPEDYPIKTE
jgi:translation elongation factor P/translation initiation factor 5A